MLAPIGSRSSSTRAVLLPRWFDAAIVWMVAALALIMLVRFGHDSYAGGDWAAEAAPCVDALLQGHFRAFLGMAPPYGGSLLLRAPFLELTRLWHASPVNIYDAGAAPCEAALVALALWLSHRMGQRGCTLTARAVTAALCIANPFTFTALAYGHPEEMLGAALCVSAVLCAQDDRAILSGVLVGLATANKAWGVLAAGPVLVLLSRRRTEAVITMVAVAGAVMTPFMLVRSGGIVGQADAAGASTGGLFTPWQLWWFFGHHSAGLRSSFRAPPAWLAPFGHTLPIALMPPLSVAFALRTRHSPSLRKSDALLLLALLALLRCALDPWDISYYAAPFIAALLAWECTAQDGPPTITLVATLVAWFALQGSKHAFGEARDLLAIIFTICVVPAIAAIAMRLLGPRGHSAAPADSRAV